MWAGWISLELFATLSFALRSPKMSEIRCKAVGWHRAKTQKTSFCSMRSLPATELRRICSLPELQRGSLSFQGAEVKQEDVHAEQNSPCLRTVDGLGTGHMVRCMTGNAFPKLGLLRKRIAGGLPRVAFHGLADAGHYREVRVQDPPRGSVQA